MKNQTAITESAIAALSFWAEYTKTLPAKELIVSDDDYISAWLGKAAR
jgi:hypothetical protein